MPLFSSALTPLWRTGPYLSYPFQVLRPLRQDKLTASELVWRRGTQKLVAGCKGEGWGFHGRFNSGFGGLFSLAMDSQASLGELVCLPFIGGGETILRAFCSSALWQIYQTLTSSSGCRNAGL
jgi:hypothetical protein